VLLGGVVSDVMKDHIALVFKVQEVHEVKSLLDLSNIEDVDTAIH
jgi:hypothetical protein